MTYARRQFLQLATAFAAAPAITRRAWAQDYPTRPVRMIVPFAPGGAADISGRLIGQWLSDRLGQPFIIENRPGGGTNIGTEAVATAAPDGYTLLVANAGNAINATLYRKLDFNFIRDLVPVAGVVRAPHVLFVAPSFPAKTVGELIAYAKANPGKLNFASAGTGTANHIAGEMFKMLAGIDMVHVPYRGGAPAIADVLSGQVQVMFADVLTMAAQMKGGSRFVRSPSPPMSSCRRCPTPRPSPPPCRDSIRVHGGAFAHRAARRARSSTSSTPRSTAASPIPRSSSGSTRWAC